MKRKQQLLMLILIFSSAIFQNCNREESKGDDESKYGYLQFYQATDLGLGSLSVYINGNFEGAFSTVDPDGPNSTNCEINGFSKKLEAGSYYWKVTNASGNVKWENTSTVQKYGICTSTKLTK